MKKEKSKETQATNDLGAPWLAAICSNTLFRECWKNEDDLVFKPFAAAVMMLGHVESLSSEHRKTLYHEISTIGRKNLISKISGEKVSSATVRLLAKTNWPQFRLQDWQAFININLDTKISRVLAHLDRIEPVLIHQVKQIPDELIFPNLLQVLNRLAVPSDFWQRMKTTFDNAITDHRIEIIAAAKNIKTVGDFWDVYFLCVDNPSQPFPLAKALIPFGKLLQPIVTPAEMRSEGLKMQNCLARLIGNSVTGRAIYFRSDCDVQATAELIANPDGWQTGRMLGLQNKPLKPTLRRQINHELEVLAQRIPFIKNNDDYLKTLEFTKRLRSWVRNTFPVTEIELLATALRTIRGRSIAMDNGAFAIFEIKCRGYVQFMSDMTGHEYLFEISSHKNSPSLDNYMGASAVEVIVGTGFQWPLGKKNFLRYFSITSDKDLLMLSEIGVGMLAKVCGHQPGQPIKQKMHIP